MNLGDRELLDKQFRWLSPSPRNDGAMIFAVVGVFLAGMTLGGILFAHKSEPVRMTASNGTLANISLSSGTPAARESHSDL
jgi:hypothetical protein